MTQQLKELYTLTKETMLKFENETEQNRETLIVDFEQFIEQRGKLLQDVQGPYTDEEIKLGQELIQMDQKIKTYVDSFLLEFKSEINSLEKKRQSNKKYVNPYANVLSNNGSFIDKKN
ncbi:hypothetical protein ACLIA0_06485 [Bacillaceae bacterium W0354]